jgi:hypothetical protein
MKVSFTGSQSGMTPFQYTELVQRLKDFGCTELVNGYCIGSDEKSILAAIEAGVRIFTLYPSILKQKQSRIFGTPNRFEIWQEIEIDGQKLHYLFKTPRKPLERNHLIVMESEQLIATPKEFSHTVRSGTWATIRSGWKTKKKVLVIPPIDRESANGQGNTGSNS